MPRTPRIGQEVFIKVYRSLGSFKSESKFSTWIYRIAHNTCIDNHRKKKFRLLSLSPREENDRQMNVPDREPLPEDQMVSREKYDLIKECIAELKPDYKSIIILRDIQKLYLSGDCRHFEYTPGNGKVQHKPGQGLVAGDSEIPAGWVRREEG